MSIHVVVAVATRTSSAGYRDLFNFYIVFAFFLGGFIHPYKLLVGPAWRSISWHWGRPFAPCLVHRSGRRRHGVRILVRSHAPPIRVPQCAVRIGRWRRHHCSLCLVVIILRPCVWVHVRVVGERWWTGVGELCRLRFGRLPKRQRFGIAGGGEPYRSGSGVGVVLHGGGTECRGTGSERY